MKTNKIAIAYTKGKGFNILTISNNTPMCYAELVSFMYDMANAIAEFDRDANNECEENIQMTESDKNLKALKIFELARTQANVVHIAKVLMGSDVPIVGGMLNFLRTIISCAFFQGWDSCLENYDAVKETIKEE